MSADLTPYLDLVTSEHKPRPKFIASLSAVLQPLADLTDQILALPQAFDLDAAVGKQLDVLGEWVGVSRILNVPLSTVFFSFDTANLGFDQGIWDQSGIGGLLVNLADDDYRILLKSRILNNHWDGSIPSAYAIWDALFAGTGYQLFIIDYGDLSMTMGLNVSGPLSAPVQAMFTGGYLTVKPAGIRIRDYQIVMV